MLIILVISLRPPSQPILDQGDGVFLLIDEDGWISAPQRPRWLTASAPFLDTDPLPAQTTPALSEDAWFPGRMALPISWIGALSDEEALPGAVNFFLDEDGWLSLRMLWPLPPSVAAQTDEDVWPTPPTGSIVEEDAAAIPVPIRSGLASIVFLDTDDLPSMPTFGIEEDGNLVVSQVRAAFVPLPFFETDHLPLTPSIALDEDSALVTGAFAAWQTRQAMTDSEELPLGLGLGVDEDGYVPPLPAPVRFWTVPVWDVEIGTTSGVRLSLIETFLILCARTMTATVNTGKTQSQSVRCA